MLMLMLINWQPARAAVAEYYCDVLVCVSAAVYAVIVDKVLLCLSAIRMSPRWCLMVVLLVLVPVLFTSALCNECFSRVCAPVLLMPVSAAADAGNAVML